MVLQIFGMNSFMRLFVENNCIEFKADQEIIFETDKLFVWRFKTATENQERVKLLFKIFNLALLPLGKVFDDLPLKDLKVSYGPAHIVIKANQSCRLKATRSDLYTTIPTLFKRMLSSNRLILKLNPGQAIIFTGIDPSDKKQFKHNPEKFKIYFSAHLTMSQDATITAEPLEKLRKVIKEDTNDSLKTYALVGNESGIRIEIVIKEGYSIPASPLCH